MDYEIEVKKVYPSAWLVGVGNSEAIIVYHPSDTFNTEQLCNPTFPKSDAWQSAYQTLKQQGKIK